MYCIKCGDDGVFNRVVTSRETRLEIWALCSACEEEIFTYESIREGFNESCSICNSAHEYIIPVIDFLRTDDDGSVAEIEVVIEADTPQLCTGCLDSIAPMAVDSTVTENTAFASSAD